MKKNETKSNLPLGIRSNPITLKRPIPSDEKQGCLRSDGKIIPTKKKCSGNDSWPPYMINIVTGIVRTYNQTVSRVPDSGEDIRMASPKDILTKIRSVSSKFQQFALFQRFVEFETQVSVALF